MDQTTMRNRTVLVTGGSGFIGLWMIAALLQRGYTVRSTLRNPALEEDIRGAIETQTDAGNNLSFIQADLLSGTRWTSAARDRCACSLSEMATVACVSPSM